MNSKEIGIQVYNNGFGQTMLANVIECSPSMVSKVLNRKAISMRVSLAVSKATDKPLEEVFPELIDSKESIQYR